MIFNSLFTDANFFRNFPIGLVLQPVHQEYASGTTRHCKNCAPQATTQIRSLHRPCLVWADRCVTSFIQRK